MCLHTSKFSTDTVKMQTINPVHNILFEKELSSNLPCQTIIWYIFDKHEVEIVLLPPLGDKGLS